MQTPLPPIITLPPEMHLLLADVLPSPSLSTLSRTTRRLSSIFLPVLYTRRLRSTDDLASSLVFRLSRHNNSISISHLLSAGADCSYKDSHGWTGLHWASREGHTEVVKAYCAHWTAMKAQAAANDNGKYIFPVHVVPDDIPREDGEEPYQLKEWQGLNLEAENPNGWRPLHWAADRGHAECVQALLDAGVDMHARTNTGRTALHQAVLYSHVGAVRTLLDNGAEMMRSDARTRWDRGSTPGHFCCERADLTMLKALLAYCGQPGFPTVVEFIEARDAAGWTLLMSAIDAGSTECAQFLLDLGAVPKARSVMGDTALHIAARRSNLGMLVWLYDHGWTDVDARDGNGATPLIVAAERGRVGMKSCGKIVESLLQWGADWRVVDRRGLDAVAAARRADVRVSVRAILKWEREHGHGQG